MLRRKDLEDTRAWLDDPNDLVGAECKPAIRALLDHIAALEQGLRELENAGSDLLAIYRDGYCEGDYAADVANRLGDASASARRLLGEGPDGD